MIYLQQLSQKIKYNNVIRLFHDGLVKIGIKFSFFYLVVEGLHRDIPEYELNQFPDYSVEFLGEIDIAVISSIQERQYLGEKLLQRFKNGCVCLGVKKDGDIAAFTWFNTYECTYEGYRFTLKENEAYLFDSYTLIEHRGKKIAPFIRYQSYKELKKLGKTTLYSISELVNKQSINFKKKLDARFVLLSLYISLFKKWEFSIPLKRLIPEDEYVQS